MWVLSRLFISHDEYHLHLYPSILLTNKIPSGSSTGKQLTHFPEMVIWGSLSAIQHFDGLVGAVTYSCSSSGRPLLALEGLPTNTQNTQPGVLQASTVEHSCLILPRGCWQFRTRRNTRLARLKSSTALTSIVRVFPPQTSPQQAGPRPGSSGGWIAVRLCYPRVDTHPVCANVIWCYR
jgi:hypothetical protein